MKTAITSDPHRLHEPEPLGHAARCMIGVRGLDHLSAGERLELERVTRRFPFRANDYYLDLIDWNDPHDPIRRLVVPDVSELDTFGVDDASDEASNTRLPGLQHKYGDTALLLITDQCAAFCRYCFRKRLFRAGGRETAPDISAGLTYIRQHPEITDVLLTGGDALALPTSRLTEIVESMLTIDHLHTVRLGSKMLAYNPARVLGDERLHALLRHAASSGKSIYLMCHFDHPREFTPVAVEALELVQRLGVRCVNQSPITIGVNDDPDTLTSLLQTCTDLGCPQYYIFQCRPTTGNASFAVPITRALLVITEARSRVSGLSRRARYCMSHASGKVEVVGMDDSHIYARYHRAKDPADEGRMLVYRRDDDAVWLDDLVSARTD